MKRRVCARSSDSFLFVDKPFFLLEVKLQLPRVRVVPALEDVQRATNKAALAVIQAFRRVPEWGAIGKKSPVRRKASLRDATAARHSAARRAAALKKVNTSGALPSGRGGSGDRASISDKGGTTAFRLVQASGAVPAEEFKSIGALDQ